MTQPLNDEQWSELVALLAMLKPRPDDPWFLKRRHRDLEQALERLGELELIHETEAKRTEGT